MNKRPEVRRGRRLGEFVLGEQLGRGGFADVFHAHQPSLGRYAVVKILRGASSRERVEQFEREARMASHLDHPYAAHVYAFGVEPDGLMWMAMELVRGVSLADWLDNKGALPLGRFVGLFERLCEVVHTAHGAGLVHRDIKPANVMVVTRAGKLLPKLLDFGIAMVDDTPARGLPRAVARLPLDEPRSTEDDSTDPPVTADRARVTGTPAYMAPEQWYGGTHDRRVDVYALGALAYRCLTGRAAFVGKTPSELYLAHTRAPVPSLGDNFPRALDGVLARALAKDAAQRFTTTLELAEAFQRAATDASDWVDAIEARSWLQTAPPHLAACVAAIRSAHTAPEASEATHRWLLAAAQWIGVTALAATAAHGTQATPAALVARLYCETITARDWLELAAALCAPYADREEDFPIPELVEWFTDHEGERRAETLLSALALVRGEPNSYPRELVGRVLRGMRFMPGYTLLVGETEWNAHSRIRDSAAVWISDGEGNPLVELSPLVEVAAPVPGEALELFVVLGGGRSMARQIAYPEGFERDAPNVWPWLTARFGNAVAERDATIADRAPYRGLQSFGAEDADLYFGRERLVDQLFNRVLVHPFVALTGPSGSGKSSLVHAGLVPRLPEGWFAIAMRPGRDPVAALDAALVDAGAPGLDAALPRLIGWLREARLRLLLIIDQAEELLTLAEPEQRSYLAAILAHIVAIAGDRARVVVTIRHDFIGRADEIPEWRELIQHNLLLVTAPSRDELASMVVGPASHVGYEFDDAALVDDMVAAVIDRPGALPLLSFTTSRLWDARDPLTLQMTRASYVAMGGVAGALTHYAESVYTALTARQQTIARALFRRLITADATSAPTRRDELVSLDADAPVVLDSLISARLLVAIDEDAGGELIAIVHEALAERWPRLIQWRADDASGARHRDELRAAAALWVQRGHAASYLWRGETLATYREWAPRWVGSLTASERAFGQASVRAARRVRRARWLLVAGALAALSVALIVTIALYQRADHNRDEAEGRFTDMLEDRGRNELLADRPLRALLYFGAAYERGRDGPAMRVALGQTARAMDRERGRARIGERLRHLMRANDAMFTIHEGAPTRSWQLRDGKFAPIATYAYDGDDTGSATGVSPTGNTIAQGGRGPLLIWDRNGTRLARVTPEAGINVIALTDDVIATDWGGRQAVVLWDRAGKQLAVLGDPRGKRGSMSSLVFTEDASRLITTYADGAIEMWSVSDRTRLWRYEAGRPLMGAQLIGERVIAHSKSGEVIGLTQAGEVAFRVEAHKTVFSLAAAPTLFVTAGAETTVKLWSLDGKPLATLDHVAPIFYTKLSSDHRWLLTSGTDTVATLWDVERRLRVAQIDIGSEIIAAHFGPDGSVITVDGSGWAQTWDAAPDNLVASFNEHRNEVFSLALAPDGASAATVGADRFARVWRLDTGAQIAQLPTSTELIGEPFRQGVAFLTDGRLVAPSFFGAAVWDVTTGLRVGAFPEHGALQYVATAKQHVATSNSSGAEGHVQLWDTATQRRLAYLARSRNPSGLAITPEGDRIAVCDGAEVSVWHVGTDRVWTHPSPGTHAVALSADGRLVGAGSSQGYVRIYDVETGVVVREIKQPGRALAVAFSPDGALIASAVANTRVYVWEVATGNLAAAFAGHDNIINELAFARDGTRLVSVSRDGRALVWRIQRELRPPPILAAMIRERLPLRLSGAELVVNERETR